MSFVLLNQEGIVTKKLQLVSLPNGYLIPEGMTLSWRTELELSTNDSHEGLFPAQKEPVMAFFYLGNAQALVKREDISDADWQRYRFNLRKLVVTVQGSSAKDVNDLRDKIMELIQSNSKWETRNDLNPKPSFWKRILGLAA